MRLAIRNNNDAFFGGHMHFQLDGIREIVKLAVIAALLAVLPHATAGAAASVGDVYVYRVGNGYINNSDLGKLRYRIEKVGADRIEVAVTADNPRAGIAHAAIYSSDGNWLRGQINSHDQRVDYVFAAPYPAYAFPLESGKSWSQRVDATSAATGKTSSVRIDGEILGTERITVPAGTFDVVKVRRRVYAGDHDGDRMETTTTETDWYAPALGRSVRLESRSEWMDTSRCSDTCRPQLGDWLVYVLVEANPPRR
jgi:hypothetical protein